MILLLIVILVLIILIAILIESVFGMDHYVAGYTAMAIVGAGIVAILGFYLLTAKGRAIVRTWNINDIRKKRIERDIIDAHMKMIDESLSKEDLKLIREIDRITGKSNDDEYMNEAAVAAAAAYNQSHQANGGS